MPFSRDGILIQNTSCVTIPGRVTTGNPSIILCTGKLTPDPSTPIGSTCWYAKGPTLFWEAFEEVAVTIAGFEFVNVRLTGVPLRLTNQVTAII